MVAKSEGFFGKSLLNRVQDVGQRIGAGYGRRYIEFNVGVTDSSRCELERETLRRVAEVRDEDLADSKLPVPIGEPSDWMGERTSVGSEREEMIGAARDGDESSAYLL